MFTTPHVKKDQTHSDGTHENEGTVEKTLWCVVSLRLES